MKIGIYGGIANNMYVFAKAFNACGVDICYIRDRSDRFPFSQPIWEDLELSLNYEEVSQAVNWSWGDWSAIESKLGWEQPDWVFDPLKTSLDFTPKYKFDDCSFYDQLLLWRYLSSSPYRVSVLQKMRECNVLLVCGVEGSILARLSGRPYIIWPYGADLLHAAGLLRSPIYKPIKYISHSFIHRQLTKAFQSAICIGNHEPSGITSDYYGAETYIQRLNVVFMPIPIPVRVRHPVARRKSDMFNLLKEQGVVIPQDAVVGFVPSRIDYEWKGQDKLLQAIDELQVQLRSAKVRFVFSGWGTDFYNARNFARDNKIDDLTIFLDVALSKPLLFKYYLAADFVVDQFNVGMYGTSALEAMASGGPLMIWLNENYERSWGKPPVINVHTVDEIFTALKNIIEGKINLDVMGNELQAWMGRIHGPAGVVNSLMEIFNNPINIAKGWR